MLTVARVAALGTAIVLLGVGPAALAQGPPCPFPASVSSPDTSQTISPAGGTALVHILVDPPFCGGWAAVSLSPFVTIVGPSSGSFDGVLQLAVAANTTSATRTMQVMISGQSNSIVVTIAQDPLPASAIPALSTPAILLVAALLALAGMRLGT